MGNSTAHNADGWWQAGQEGFRPDPVLTVSEWADAHRILSGASAAEPGPWRTDRAPYLREIMDRLSATSRTEMVVWQAGSQVSKTEAGLCWIGYAIHHAPGPFLLLEPTGDMAKDLSQGRLAPMIETTPALAERVADPKSRNAANTVRAKQFPGGELFIRGANSPAQLSSTPIRYVFLDEVDRYPPEVGEEGDPIDLAIQRSATFARRKILMTSTPTVAGVSRIARAMATVPTRRFYVPCPACDEYQVLEWSGVVWSDLERSPDDAAYRCCCCGEIIEHRYKSTMLAKGEWRWTDPDNAPSGEPKRVGYYLSALYSPWKTWGEIAAQLVEVANDPPRLKAWTNLQLGECWDDSNAGEGFGDDALGQLMLRVANEEWDGALVPSEVAFLTAGVDTQDDRFELEVVGWGAGMESWSVDYQILHCDTADPGAWAVLDEVIKTAYMAEGGKPLHIVAAAVDSGGHRTQQAYDFARQRGVRKFKTGLRFVWAIKGMAGDRRIWSALPSRSDKYQRAPVYMVGVDSAKADIYDRLRVSTPGPGCCHFPVDRDREFYLQLASEYRHRYVVRGRWLTQWRQRTGQRNEALDCRVYAYAAACGLALKGYTPERVLAHLAQLVGDTQAPAPSSKPKRRSRGSARPGWGRSKDWGGGRGDYWDKPPPDDWFSR